MRWMDKAALGLVLLSVILTLRWLTYDLLYGDEWWALYTSGSAYYGPLSISQIWHNITVVDLSGMATYNFVLAGWDALVGGSVFSVRVLSLLFGTLGVAMTYRAGGLLFGRRVGLIAAAILATSAFYIDYMHEVRAYALYVLMTSALIAAYADLTRRNTPSTRHYLALVLAAGGVSYAHYLGFLAYCGLGFYHVTSGLAPRNPIWRKTLATLIIGGLLYTPWIPVIFQTTANGEADFTRQYYSLRAGGLIAEILRMFSHNVPWVLVGLLAVALSRLTTRAGRVVWITFGAAFIATVLLNTWLPFIIHIRYVMFAWPLLAILTALGFDALIRYKRWAWAGVALWMALGIYTGWVSMEFIRSGHGYAPRAPAAGVEAARDYLLYQRRRPDDLVIFHVAWENWEQMNLYALDYVMRPTGLRFEQVEYMDTSWERDPALYRADIERGLHYAERVWVVIVPDIPTTQKSDVFWAVFLEDYDSCGVVLKHPHAIVTRYQRKHPDGTPAPCL